MKYSFLLLIAAALTVVSCKKDDPQPTPTPTDPYATQKQQMKETYADMAYANYQDSYTKAVELKTAINTFVATPTQANFNAAKQAWLDAREPYGQSEIFRFVDGPIDNPADGPEGLINAWPMDEAYVDYVQGSANSGIINDLTTYPTINESTLVSANEFGGETNVSLGFHAIEFLLWGQDLSTSGPGARPYTDFVTDGSGTASNQARRGEYLNICIDLLVQALDQVKSAWDPAGTNNYRTTWLALDNQIALRKIFNSIRVMSGFELSGERMFTAYDNQDQEDEHSCFADNTHRDIALNALGIKNLYLGQYTKVDGTVVSGYSLRQLVALQHDAKNTEMVNQLNDAETKIGLMYTPFDQAIILPAERPKVLDAVNSLIAEETIILEIAALYGITF